MGRATQSTQRSKQLALLFKFSTTGCLEIHFWFWVTVLSLQKLGVQIRRTKIEAPHDAGLLVGLQHHTQRLPYSRAWCHSTLALQLLLVLRSVNCSLRKPCHFFTSTENQCLLSFPTANIPSKENPRYCFLGIIPFSTTHAQFSFFLL